MEWEGGQTLGCNRVSLLKSYKGVQPCTLFNMWFGLRDFPKDSEGCCITFESLWLCLLVYDFLQESEALRSHKKTSKELPAFRKLDVNGRGLAEPSPFPASVVWTRLLKEKHSIIWTLTTVWICTGKFITSVIYENQVLQTHTGMCARTLPK